MDKVYIIGAGQLGSRHLQALKSVNRQLDISIIDPNEESLKMAETRYAEMPNGAYEHHLTFSHEMLKSHEEISLAIVATDSGHRRAALEYLIDTNKVKYLVIEKLLFTYIHDLYAVGDLIKINQIKAWVNCPMRMMPFYRQMKEVFDKTPVIYHSTGSNYGLITNLIHYIDFMIYLSDCEDFELDVSMLDKEISNSKRKGYLEMTGTIIAKFKNGSVGVISCFKEGSFGLSVTLATHNKRVFINEVSGKAYWETREGHLQEQIFRIPFQSEMTKELVEVILDTGDCELPTYDTSAKTHSIIMSSVLDFLHHNTDFSSSGFLFT